VSLAYYFEDYYKKNPAIIDADPPSSAEGDNIDATLSDDKGESVLQNLKSPYSHAENSTYSRLAKRIPKILSSPKEWALSQICTIPGYRWNTRRSGSIDVVDNAQRYAYRYNDDPGGAGQTVYIMSESVIWTWHEVRQPIHHCLSDDETD